MILQSLTQLWEVRYNLFTTPIRIKTSNLSENRDYLLIFPVALWLHQCERAKCAINLIFESLAAQIQSRSRLAINQDRAVRCATKLRMGIMRLACDCSNYKVSTVKRGILHHPTKEDLFANHWPISRMFIEDSENSSKTLARLIHILLKTEICNIWVWKKLSKALIRLYRHFNSENPIVML